MKVLTITADQQNELKSSLLNQDPIKFDKVIYALENANNSPWGYGTEALADYKINYGDKEETLLEYVFQWPTPLSKDQCKICNTLFDALGKYLLNGSVNNDPLVRACREGNLDLVTILIPRYLTNQENIIDTEARTKENQEKKDNELSNMTNRILEAIDATTSPEILQALKGSNASNMKIVSPSLAVRRIKRSDGTDTIGTMIEAKIIEKQKKINERHQRPPLVYIQQQEQQQEQQQRVKLETTSTYWKHGTGLGFAFGCFAIGCLVGTAFLVEHCTKEYSARTFDASKMFNQLATFIWESVFQQNNTPASKALFISGTGFTAVTAGVGAVVGNRIPKLGG